MKKYCCEGDRFFFLTHRFYYLSKKFTLAQRIECGIDHYAYEDGIVGPSITSWSIDRRASSCGVRSRPAGNTPYGSPPRTTTVTKGFERPLVRRRLQGLPDVVLVREYGRLWPGARHRDDITRHQTDRNDALGASGPRSSRTRHSSSVSRRCAGSRW